MQKLEVMYGATYDHVVRYYQDFFSKSFQLDIVLTTRQMLSLLTSSAFREELQGDWNLWFYMRQLLLRSIEIKFDLYPEETKRLLRRLMKLTAGSSRVKDIVVQVHFIICKSDFTKEQLREIFWGKNINYSDYVAQAAYDEWKTRV